MKHSKLSIATIILSILFFPAAIVTGLIDLTKGSKEEKHVLTYVGLGITALLLVVGITNYKPNSTTSTQTVANQDSTQEIKQDPAPEEDAKTSEEVTTSEATTDKKDMPEPTTKKTDTQEVTQEVEQVTLNATISQEQALRSAKQYLGYTAFSHDGLIEQLKFEQFSDEDAAFAADNCGANWNEQALKSAKQYLVHTAFSYSGLIKQLEFDKFTEEQATYGADNCGADWKEQAVKAGKQYLDYSAFSHGSLVDQLEFDGFTNEEAEYGASQNGL